MFSKNDYTKYSLLTLNKYTYYVIYKIEILLDCFKRAYVYDKCIENVKLYSCNKKVL